MDAVQFTRLFADQIRIMTMKHFQQKQRKGREFLKETLLIPFFTIGFIGFLLFLANPDSSAVGVVYELHDLPPLSAQNPYGIFSSSSLENSDDTYISKVMYYSPEGHPGVEALINALVARYPSVNAIGAASPDAITSQYTEHIFDTWAALSFTLSPEQSSTGQLIPDNTTATEVVYSIMTNPYMAPLSNDNFTSVVYNDASAPNDAFWSTGYMTLENFVSTYLAQQYPSTPTDFAVDTYLQRYPRSDVYDDESKLNSMPALRWAIWKWIAPTTLAICMFVPMLSLMTECVRERQFRMKDLLEISGLMNPSYWFSYLLTSFTINQITIWSIIASMLAFSVITINRTTGYGALLTVYTLGLCAFSLFAGFLIFRAEYYGLPVFILNSAITIGGCFMGFAYSIPSSLKLFICFLHPSLGLTMGVFVIETYIYHHQSAGVMDFNYVDNTKNYPSLNAILGVMLCTATAYMLLTLGMPFDWVTRVYNTPVENFLQAKDDVVYPCDREADTSVSNAETLLKVDDLSHIYPDGTHAVKDIGFNIKQGEVLSFLGANGAGKSTTMGMLCGTLDATFGDATVNGYSITNNRTLARRNLGIAMQQDIIWDDVSVEDHLFLFGRLRGLGGAKLREDVDKMIASLGFPEKRKSLAGTLSGGQKRRLCVGISMVGGNSVVYLDEPTAGLDPVSRRQLWELVQKNRAGRAILLTTHFMDEADVLGDRIAIVKEGRLRALGSSKFLKKQFGLGYLLKMSLVANADVKRIVNRVAGFVPEVSVGSNAGTELSLRLPKETVSVFPTMFEALEAEASALGVLSYGIETTTLEEVFMRIVNEDNEALLANHEEANRMLSATAEERDANNKKIAERDEARNPLASEQIDSLLTKGEYGYGAFFNQVRIMFHKRFYQFARSKGQWSLGVVAPVVIAICIAAIISNMPNQILGGQPSLTVPQYVSYFTTPIAGATSASANAAYDAAFGTDSASVYVGATYSDLTTYVTTTADELTANSSTAGIYFESATNFTVMYNASFPGNLAGAVTNVLSSVVSTATGGLLTVTNSYAQLPMNKLDQQINSAILISLLFGVFAGSLGAGMSIVVGGERVTQVKHQQLASGGSRLAYWSANFIFDFLIMFFELLIFGGILAAFSPSDFGDSGYGTVIGGGIFFITASIFRFYIVSFWVADVRMAQSIYFYGSMASMFMLLAIYCNILFNGADGNVMDPAVVACVPVLVLLDPGFGFYLIVMFQHNFVGVLSQNPHKSILLDLLALDFYFLIFGTALYLVILFIMEGGLSIFYPSSLLTTSNVQQKPRQSELLMGSNPDRVSSIVAGDGGLVAMRIQSETSSVNSQSHITPAEHPAMRLRGQVDPDVAAEREKVRNIVESGTMNTTQSAIFLSNLKKIYYGKGTVPTKIAVKDVSISIQRGEVFGLLGANGAGKTTLLKMVSGQELPTSGFGLINGYDVVRQTSEAQRSMGLCPQFDTLVERLTVRENLLFFGQIKGLSGDKLTEVVEAFMAAMNIKRYQNKLIQQLSGGNRRKVSLAVALLGNPPTVYLDEPSTGLDPVASRLMWRLLSRISATKSTAIVLTTHNMLECEAVCTRICIMKLGAMVCLGDSQHLRSVHGTGFLLEMSLVNPAAVDAAKKFVYRAFPHATVVDEHVTMVNFEIPKGSIEKLSAAFKLMESQKQELGIIDYALSQSTLEQVFLKQIRPNNNDVVADDDQKAVERTPVFQDYLVGYGMWLMAGFIPGLHHFYLGNTMRGVKYLCTFNEVYAGWALDLFEMHVLIQKSVQQYGHTSGFCRCCHCCGCCASLCCGVPKKTIPSEQYHEAGNNDLA